MIEETVNFESRLVGKVIVGKLNETFSETIIIQLCTVRKI